jgi:predicted lipid-binding transport protein (Tim44 family)
MDLLMFGGIAWLLYKIFLSKPKARTNEHFYAQDEPNKSGNFTQTSATEKAGFDTDVLFRNNKSKHTSYQNNNLPDADFDDQPIPDSFDRKAFLEGAKAAYRQLQEAWDREDLAEIRSLTTDKVFAEIQQQIKSDPNQNHTDILRLDAELLDYRELGSEKETVVLFDSILREQSGQQAEQVKEIWHFIQPINSSQRTWYLDGIQQMEV